MIVHSVYEKVGFKQRKTGKCPKCGKTASRVEEFYQTINPWNRKTREQIMDEEKANYREWLNKPVYHAKC